MVRTSCMLGVNQGRHQSNIKAPLNCKPACTPVAMLYSAPSRLQAATESVKYCASMEACSALG